SLIFGTPVPGYEAPEDTVVPYARVVTALVRPIATAYEAKRLTADGGRVAPSLRGSLAPVIEAFPAVPPSAIVGLVEAWTTLIGVISSALLGPWRNPVLEPEVLLDELVDRLGASFGLR